MNTVPCYYRAEVPVSFAGCGLGVPLSSYSHLRVFVVIWQWERASSLVSLLIRTLILLSQNCILTISFIITCMKSLFPNIVTLGIGDLVYEFWKELLWRTIVASRARLCWNRVTVFQSNLCMHFFLSTKEILLEVLPSHIMMDPRKRKMFKILTLQFWWY